MTDTFKRIEHKLKGKDSGKLQQVISTLVEEKPFSFKKSKDKLASMRMPS